MSLEFDQVLRIRADLVEAMTAHARAEHPLEACGVIAGPAGAGIPTRFIPLVNAARSESFYEVDPRELLHLYRELEARSEEVVVIYHSHTSTAAYPSLTDRTLAAEPGAHFVIISTRGQGAAEMRSFRIIDSEVTEEKVVTYDSVP